LDRKTYTGADGSEVSTRALKLEQIIKISFFDGGNTGYSASTLYKLACAAAKTKLNHLDPFQPNSLIDKQVQVVVKHTKSGFAKIHDYMEVQEELEPLTEDEKADPEEILTEGANESPDQG
jgi:hypothetical protein